MNTRAELDAYFDAVPDHVVTVVDQAYFEYIDDPDYPDAIAEYFKAGRRIIVLRTFSKIYGLAGLRVGYGVTSAELVTALGKTRRAFDVTTPAQEAALVSLDAPDELERRRRLNADGPDAARADSARGRVLGRRSGGRQLPLRRPRRGRAAFVRRAAARGRHRPPACRLRRDRRQSASRSARRTSTSSSPQRWDAAADAGGGFLKDFRPG